ncbi:uncharacterized protein LOC125648436 [Ostrea edulis]|uniref:uncharacterized protein LOC125648436 n=1 Tax=Ostrea edulis TaxID=37623 RepID=UPI002094B3F9|nr:uncharacterized protein LOC125648436 [Ostrea edulis]XP_048731512.1 uncharacterized protein LOC125648436 [Ostrea edulis]
MYSYWTTITRSHLIHDAWNLGTDSGLAVAMIIGAVLSIVFEFIDLIHFRIFRRFIEIENSFQQSTACNPSVLPRRFITTLLYIVRVSSAYILMLCVMSMNIWILVSVLLGTMLGFFTKQYFKKIIFLGSEEKVKINDPEHENRPNCNSTPNQTQPLLLQTGACSGSRTQKQYKDAQKRTQL